MKRSKVDKVGTKLESEKSTFKEISREWPLTIAAIINAFVALRKAETKSGSCRAVGNNWSGHANFRILAAVAQESRAKGQPQRVEVTES